MTLGADDDKYKPFAALGLSKNRKYNEKVELSRFHREIYASLLRRSLLIRGQLSLSSSTSSRRILSARRSGKS